MEEILFAPLSKDKLVNEIAARVVELLKQDVVPKTKEEDQEFLTREEVAKMCKVKSLSTLWCWQRQNLLKPSSKAGRKPLYLKKDVINFLRGRSK